MTSVTGVVLAAGLSSRMGRPKAELVIDDTTFLDRALGLFAGADIDALCAVVAPGAAAPTLPGVTVVENPDPTQGSITSLLAGAGAFPGHWLVYVPVDLPTLDQGVVAAAVGVTRAIEPWALVTGYADGVGHPFAVSPDLLESIADEKGDKVVWSKMNAHPAKVAKIDLPGFARPVDVNTLDEYRRLVGDL